MAENKKSFVLYTDLIHTVKKLPKEKQAELFVLILEYVNDLNPKINDLLLEVAFEPIKQALKRDLKKYETALDKKSEGARIGNLKRWHSDLYDKYQSKELSLDSAEKIAYQRKVSHTDKNIASVADNVNDSDNDSVSDILLKKETKERFNFKKELLDLGFEEILVKDWLVVRKNKKASNTETAFNTIKNEVSRTEIDKNKILKMHVDRSWSGFKVKWYENELKKESPNKSSETADYKGNR